MVADLVSIITPCYGTADYLPTLLKSILIQTHPKIELFVIDDGSPDDIESVVDKFRQPFATKNYPLHYVRQSNSGQSVAIQNALNLINGEFLVWPDSDDFYAEEDAIAKMVDRFRQSGPKVGMVRTQESIVEDTPEHTLIRILGKQTSAEDLFEDCMLQKNGFYYCAGAYMVRSDALLQSTELPIYTEKDAGQNWQLMLPVLYHFKCSTIPEPLYNVVQRKNSHSRAKKSYEQSKQRIDTYRKTIIGTLHRIKNMQEADLSRYEEMVEDHYKLIYFENALGYGEKKEASFIFNELKSRRIKPTAKSAIKYRLLRVGLLEIVQNLNKLIRGR